MIFEGVTINCNQYLHWSIGTCGNYTVKNINEAQTVLTFSVMNEAQGFTKTKTLQYNESFGFTLPSDGFYKVVVTTSDGPNMPILRSGYLFETCNTYACFDKILKEKLELATKNCKAKKKANHFGDIAVANAAWLDLVIKLILLKKNFFESNTTQAMDLAVQDLDARFTNIKHFVAQCCGEESKKCGCKKQDCGCQK